MDLMEFFGFRRNDPISRAIDDAIAHLEEKNYDAAIAAIRDRALSRDPEHRRALLHLGVSHMLKGDLDIAEGILTPIAGRGRMDSERAAARVALEKIARDRGAGK